MRALRFLAAVALGAAAHAPSAPAAERVDLLLVLAADVSSSVKKPEFRLQRSGYASAFADPRVFSAIRATATGRIGVAYVEWSGPWMQKLVIDWTLIGSAEAARRFSQRVMSAPRAFSKKSTSISAAIDFAAALLQRAPYRASRRIIDISGDGDNNSGRPVAAARDDAVRKGITINGLVILNMAAGPSSHSHPPGGLAKYYRRNVIGGAGAFVRAVEDYRSFDAALIRKLIREIAQRPAVERLTSR